LSAFRSIDAKQSYLNPAYTQTVTVDHPGDAGHLHRFRLWQKSQHRQNTEHDEREQDDIEGAIAP
jgi:hypothetical protein